jgi:hypothetical protein
MQVRGGGDTSHIYALGGSFIFIVLALSILTLIVIFFSHQHQGPTLIWTP